MRQIPRNARKSEAIQKIQGNTRKSEAIQKIQGNARKFKILKNSGCATKKQYGPCKGPGTPGVAGH
jgi:hypothetical protein